MKDTKKTVRLFFDIEKELEYINSMNGAGWKLKAAYLGCVYSFEKCDAGEYTTVIVGDDSQNGTLQEMRLREGGYQVIPYKYELDPAYLYLTRESDRGEDAYYNTPEQKIFLLESIEAYYKKSVTMIAVITAVIAVLWLTLIPGFLVMFHYVAVHGDKHVMICLSAMITTVVISILVLGFTLYRILKLKKKYKQQRVEYQDSIRGKKMR